MNKNSSALIFSIAIIIAAFLIGGAYVKRNNYKGTINVTGLGSMDFTSDLIVWEGSFDKDNISLKEAANELNNEKKLIESYLI